MPYLASGSSAALLVMMMISGLAAPSLAADRMAPAEQNALVQKYCAVGHSDAARNGGLSLAHFDAAVAAPSLHAMLLSKVTGGVALDVVRRVETDAKAAALVDTKMKSGAINAAGIPVPDKKTMDALPARSLKVSDLFPCEVAEFPFASLPVDARRDLSRCFSAPPSRSSANPRP